MPTGHHSAGDLPFPEQLVYYRRRRGLGQESLSELADVHPRTVSNIERGKSRTPNHTSVMLLARALGLSPDETRAFVQAVPRRVHHRPAAVHPVAPSPTDIPAHAGVPEWTGDLIGRAGELNRIPELLGGRNRLVMLTGPPGVGKTRLAAEAALNPSLAGSADAIAFVSLVATRTATEALAVIASTMRLNPRGDDLLGTIADALGRGRQLVILDNLEQIADAPDLLASILARVPRVRLITTSRHSMAVAGGREILVQPLPIVPGDPETIPAEQAAKSSAVQLMVAVAQRERPTFRLSSGNVTAVVRLCRLLDAIPLALEIAAAQFRMLSPAMVLDRFDREADSLLDATGGHAGNHRTLAATVDWSVNLLPPIARLALTRLGVFLGGFTLDAALRVLTLGDTCPTMDRDDALSAVTVLIERNLVTPNTATDLDDSGPSDGNRYALLEMIREDALGRLAADPDAEATRRAHAKWVQDLANRVGAGLLGPSPGHWVRAVDRELGNVRVALDWCATAAANGDVDAASTGLGIAGRL